MKPCKLIECLGRPRCQPCLVMDAAYGAPQPLATVDTTPAGWAQLLIRGIVVSSKYGAVGMAELEEMARRVNAAPGVTVLERQSFSQQVPMKPESNG